MPLLRIGSSEYRGCRTRRAAGKAPFRYAPLRFPGAPRPLPIPLPSLVKVHASTPRKSVRLLTPGAPAVLREN
jgi:hypothetical protein